MWACVNVSVKEKRQNLVRHTLDCTLFVCVQSVTVSTECVIKVLMEMDSVCVNHRTLGDAVTKVRHEQNLDQIKQICPIISVMRIIQKIRMGDKILSPTQTCSEISLKVIWSLFSPLNLQVFPVEPVKQNEHWRDLASCLRPFCDPSSDWNIDFWKKKCLEFSWNSAYTD